MEGDLTWFKFRSRWIKVFKTLSKPEMDRLLDAIDAYSNDRELPDMVGREAVAWAFIETDLEADKEARRKAADAHRKAGASGGRPKTKETNLVPEETKITKMVFSKPNETKENQNALRVKEIKSKEINSLNTIAETDVSAPVKAKLTPDDPGYWRAFRENAALAETFYRVSGIAPAGDFGRWQKELKQFSEACITPEILKAAILQMRQSGLTIYSPGSVYKVARSLQAKPRVSYPAGDRWDRAAEKIEAELASDSLFSLMQPKEVRQ